VEEKAKRWCSGFRERLERECALQLTIIIYTTHPLSLTILFLRLLLLSVLIILLILIIIIIFIIYVILIFVSSFLTIELKKETQLPTGTKKKKTLALDSGNNSLFYSYLHQ
jgi:cellulose synthase/poly-beta-1,6-N-acetylglucosamine synthase-like glycosyltransferase